MKKIKAILLILVILIAFAVPLASGCSDEYVTVCSIKYSCGGETNTQYSKKQNLYTASTTITKEEYYASSSSQRIYSGARSATNLSSSYSVPDAAKGQTTYTVNANKTDKDDLKRYYCGLNFNTYVYSSCYFKGVKYTFVLVKIISDSKIIIKNTKGETTYSNCSYSIVYFS